MGTLKGHGVPTLVRAPAHDSASIEHHRLGGNFAYSTAEAHAFASVTPQISTLTHPVAETTHTHIPSPIAVPVSVERTHVQHGVAHVPTTVPVAGHAVVGHAAVGAAGYAGIHPAAGFAGYAGHPVAVAAH